MTTEHYSLSIVNHLVNTQASLVPHGYFRSKLFIAPSSINPLIAAASPVFSLLERLCLSASLPPVDQIRDNIEHELYAFYSKLRASESTMELMNVAYYLLATTVDELLGKNYLRVYHEAPQFNSFTPLTYDQAEPQQRFFEILAYIQERPNQYLDLIELVYFCLTAGFEGGYRTKVDGRQTLDNQIEHLYQLIQEHRVNKPHRLLNENPLVKTVKKSYKTTLIATTAVIGVITFALFTSHIVLENKAKTVLFRHTQLALLDD